MSRESVSVVSGVQAGAIVQERAAANPQLAAAIQASRKALTAKRWKHRDSIVAIRLRAKAAPETRTVAQQLRNFFSPVVLAQTMFVSDPVNGVVVYDGWDDGDEGTWEGAVYYENYDSNQWAYLDQQILTDVEGAPNLLHLNLHGASSREGFRTRDGNNLHPVKLGQPLSVPTACNCPMSPRPGKPGKPVPSDMECFTRTGLDRAAATCGGALVACRRVGIGYFACVGYACGGIAPAQTLAEFYRWTRDCWPQ